MSKYNKMGLVGKLALAAATGLLGGCATEQRAYNPNNNIEKRRELLAQEHEDNSDMALLGSVVLGLAGVNAKSPVNAARLDVLSRGAGDYSNMQNNQAAAIRARGDVNVVVNGQAQAGNEQFVAPIERKAETVGEAYMRTLQPTYDFKRKQLMACKGFILYSANTESIIADKENISPKEIFNSNDRIGIGSLLSSYEPKFICVKVENLETKRKVVDWYNDKEPPEKPFVDYGLISGGFTKDNEKYYEVTIDAKAMKEKIGPGTQYEAAIYLIDTKTSVKERESLEALKNPLYKRRFFILDEKK